MKEVIRANFEIGNNNKISGVMDCQKGSKKFSCWSTEFFHIDDQSNIYGKTHDNEYISLLKCLGSTSSHYKNDTKSHSCEIYSHIMLVGKEKIVPDTDKFDSISLVVGNPSKLFRRLDSFGYVNFPENDLIDALNKQEYTPNFTADKHPVIAYFNGDFDIFKQETHIGMIHAHNQLNYGKMSGINGVKIENEVIITLSFKDSISIEDAFKRANLVSLFLRFIGGKGLYFKDITLKKVVGEHDEFVVIHDYYNWGENFGEDYYSDPLIDVTTNSFLLILKNWFEKIDREIVRYSFYDTYFGDTYSSNRLITAANMFDIFPISDDVKKKPISNDAKELLESLKDQVKSDFSGFSEIKQSLLQSISIITRKSLKDKVLERLEVIKPQLVGRNTKAEDLEFIIGIAIKSRNYFVHGSEYNKLTPEHFFEFQSLFIDTFEYIYALSELIQCGWQINDASVLSSHHRIRGCEQHIDSQVNSLKKIISSQ
jgi:hypothetical protein